MVAPRFALTESDLVLLSLAYIADGDWQPLTEDVALKTILRFFAFCRSEPEQIVFDMYQEMQNTVIPAASTTLLPPGVKSRLNVIESLKTNTKKRRQGR